MAYGAIRHKRHGRKARRVELRTAGLAKKIKVTIKLDRWWHGGERKGRVRYHAKACFFPGWKVGDSYRRADGKLVHLGKRRSRLYDRCGEGDGVGPTQAVKRALVSLSKKPL